MSTEGRVPMSLGFTVNGKLYVADGTVSQRDAERLASPIGCASDECIVIDSRSPEGRIAKKQPGDLDIEAILGFDRARDMIFDADMNRPIAGVG